MHSGAAKQQQQQQQESDGRVSQAQPVCPHSPDERCCQNNHTLEVTFGVNAVHTGCAFLVQSSIMVATLSD